MGTLAKLLILFVMLYLGVVAITDIPESIMQKRFEKMTPQEQVEFLEKVNEKI